MKASAERVSKVCANTRERRMTTARLRYSQALLPTAVYEPPLLLGNGVAHLGSYLGIDGVLPGRRATEDAEGGGGGFHFSTRAGNGRFYLQTIRRLSGPRRHAIISQR
jgi:hypothetical protein